MRSGIAFPHRQAHEEVHLRPLLDRLHDVVASRPRRARVAVLAQARAPVRGAWNVQVFHGLGDAEPHLRPSARRGRSRYEQVNAHGPRWADRFEEAWRGVEVSRFGHPALNEVEGVRADPDGPLLWALGRDRRAALGGAGRSGLRDWAGQLLAVAAAGVPVLLKPHPLAARRRPGALLRRLAAARNVTVAPAAESPYRLLEGCRGVLAGAGGLGLEAHCLGLPVALARPPRAGFVGLQAELAERVPAFAPGEPGLAEWALAPPPPADAAWARDLLYAPGARRNDAFAARLRERATGAH